jgi:hypothetical protein
MSLEGNILVVDAIQTAKSLVLRGWSLSEAVVEAADDHGLTDDEQAEVQDYLKKYGAV